MEDQAIVALYWARNEAAIVETERKYHRYCWTIAWNILSNREDTEECVSDTWHCAWSTMPPQKPNSLAAFLGRIVRNLSISRWRRSRAQKRYAGLESLLSELEDCLPAPDLVEQTVERQALTKLLEQWLGQLGREDRALFLRRYWYGQSVKELATAWGLSPNQLAKRMFRLRRALKAELEREGIDV